MSIFMCQRCDNLKDSDSGCKEGANFGLICIDCINDEPDDDSEPLNPDRPFSKEQQALIDRWEAEARDDDE